MHIKLKYSNLLSISYLVIPHCIGSEYECYISKVKGTAYIMTIFSMTTELGMATGV
jgi:hypothetical protein